MFMLFFACPLILMALFHPHQWSSVQGYIHRWLHPCGSHISRWKTGQQRLEQIIKVCFLHCISCVMRLAPPCWNREPLMGACPWASNMETATRIRFHQLQWKFYWVSLTSHVCRSHIIQPFMLPTLRLSRSLRPHKNGRKSCKSFPLLQALLTNW